MRRAIEKEPDATVGEQTDIVDAGAAQPLLELACGSRNEDPVGQHQNSLIVRKRIALAIALGATLVACSRAAATAPKGWQPIAGPPSEWSTGSGTGAQTYAYVNRPFAGTLADLASAVTIDVLLHHRGARMAGSTPFQPCPGAAGVATFTLPSGRRLDEGFAVRDGSSIRTSYERPGQTPEDPNVIEAMRAALCVPPA